MISKIFSPFYFQSKLKKHFDYKKNLLPKILEEYYKFSGSNTDGRWGCDCFSTYFNRNVIKCSLLEEELDFVVQQMLQELKIEPYAYTMEQVWFNAYSSKQSQEVHCHAGVDFSGVYYLQFDPTVHKATTFINSLRWGESKRNNRFCNHNVWNNQSLYQRYNEPIVEEGTIIIFPSEMDHYVPPFFNSSTLRITCSFNVTIYSEEEKKFLYNLTKTN